MNKKIISVFSGTGLILTAGIWGFAFVIVKDSLDYVPALYMMAFRFTIAAAALAVIYRRKLYKLTTDYWRHGSILGLFLFLAYAFQTVGCNYTTAGKNAFITTVYVFLVPLLGWPLKKSRPGWYVFVAAAMSLTGIGLLALTKADSGFFSINRGDFLTIICGFFFAVHILFNEKYGEFEDPVLLTVLQFVFAAVFSWLLSPVTDGAFPLTVIKNSHVVISMLYLGIFSTMLAFLLQNICLKYMESSLAALFLSLESVFGMLFSVLLMGERMSVQGLFGCVLIFIAIILAETKFSFVHFRRNSPSGNNMV
jgi:drug/metabolite transporter (DMT)-like permease